LEISIIKLNQITEDSVNVTYY